MGQVLFHLEGIGGGHRDNHSATLTSHDPTCLLRTEEDTGKIDRHDALPTRLFNFQQGLSIANASLRNHHVKATKALDA
ncbi:hypothetical protein ccbrp13_00890 [Ktedonobacteria bacterium brp13]|nr:hypothetical protein ccbrp13_00890 [Ktedonobacteria bacterium brp13]